MKKNIDLVKVMEIGGAVLTVVASMMTGYANNQKMDKAIEEKVAEQVTKQLLGNRNE